MNRRPSQLVRYGFKIATGPNFERIPRWSWGGSEGGRQEGEEEKGGTAAEFMHGGVSNRLEKRSVLFGDREPVSELSFPRGSCLQGLHSEGLILFAGKKSLGSANWATEPLDGCHARSRPVRTQWSVMSLWHICWLVTFNLLKPTDTNEKGNRLVLSCQSRKELFKLPLLSWDIDVLLRTCGSLHTE